MPEVAIYTNPMREKVYLIQEEDGRLFADLPSIGSMQGVAEVVRCWSDRDTHQLVLEGTGWTMFIDDLTLTPQRVSGSSSRQLAVEFLGSVGYHVEEALR